MIIGVLPVAAIGSTQTRDTYITISEVAIGFAEAKESAGPEKP